MDAFDLNDPDSSQATRMVQDLLEHDISPTKSTTSHNHRLKAQTNHSIDISSDSLPSSRASHSIPQYHFHGLASTQTQSQHYEEEDEPQEGSQKENIGAAKVNKEPSPMRQLSPLPSSSRHLAAKALPTARQSTAYASPDKGSAKRATNVTFQSPQARSGTGSNTKAFEARKSPYKPPPQTTSRYKHPPRPPVRDSSQDSFAFDTDPEARLLATAQQFVIPISELTKDSPRRNTDMSSSSTSTAPMYGRRGKSPKVFVPNSDSSQSQSQNEKTQSDKSQSEGTEEDSRFLSQPQNQLAYESMDVDGEGSNDTSRSVEYELSNNRNPVTAPPIIHPDLIATQTSNQDDIEPTQPSGLPETQPSTQFDDTVPEPEPEGSTSCSKYESILRSTSNNTSSGNPRSLISMVPQQHQHRYRQFGNAQNSAPSTGAGPTPAAPSGVFQETQPSFDLQEKPPSFPEAPPQHGFPAKSFTSGASTGLPSAIPNDSMEVIPDSEPARLHARNSPKKVPNAPSKPAPSAAANSSAGKGKAPAVNEDVEMDAANEYDADLGDEEDDIPLAAVVAAAAPAKKLRGRPPGKKSANSGKGKQKEVAATPAPPSAPVAKPKAKPLSKAQKLKGEAAAKQSWEIGVVPSSVPEQDMPRSSRNLRNNRPTVIVEPPKKTKSAPQSRQTSRGGSYTPSLHPQYEQDEVVEDGQVSGSDDLETEPADEDYQDADMYAAGSSRKRKRASIDKSSAPGNGARNGLKRSKATVSGSRAKSAPYTATQISGSGGTRVFALWPQDGYYYAGTVHSTDNNNRYNIKFDDKTENWVTIDDLRALDLHVGDDVLFDELTVPAQVLNVDSLKDGAVEVLVNEVAEKKRLKYLRIAHKTILFCWNERRISPHDVSTTVKPVKRHVSPSPSKMSLLNIPAARGQRKKLLQKLGLIVTLGNMGTKMKETTMSHLKNSGAVLIEDLNTIFQMDGTHTTQNNRWTLRKDEVQWIGQSDITRLLLVADDCSQRPKFLISLALGIPCLSYRWIEECMTKGKEEDWNKYLLPQGFSNLIQGRLTQQVDYDWGTSPHQLTDIMNNRLPHKLFADMTILCIGNDVVCQPKSKRRAANDVNKNEAANSVPRIILAMGADTVEAVTEPRYASQDLVSYNFVVIKDPSKCTISYTGTNVVPWTWVKESLVASRLLPLPDAMTEPQESQEA